VAGEGRLDGDFCGLPVTDFADHDDVRILAQDGTQSTGEVVADLAVGLNLGHPGHLVFDRVLDGDDFLAAIVGDGQAGVEGG